ncbi:hypothetical protein NCCP2495_25400 [Dietzia sp. NCCP-2495]|uniref:hypothetical protein n=1 Tax=Dietzia sp. NCCP-2495 TaxID=2934675 RepID=UPI00223242A0|nr:hypothetical protein [Dietzia sp. NCCP-2495]GLB64661.1 hypothetical protein NCCP2495_25400 [Dietzia sp. NCCP-2495]
MRHPRVRPAQELARRLVAAAVVALVGAGILAVATAAPAQAAARLSVSSSLGGAVASSSGPTTFTVSGSGFQAIEGGFGGVYVGFGWVNGSSWGPSKGGTTGNAYDYVPDDQSKNNKGYQAFVAFPGSSTAGEAQGTMGSDGSFRVQLTVPGPTFTGAGGKRIDCLSMTCGFFTWGAHGVRNGANESFTPVTFQSGAAPAAEEGTAAPAGESPAARVDTRGQSGRSGAGGRASGRSPGAVSVQESVSSGSADSGAGQAGGDGGPVVPAGEASNGPVDATGGTQLSGAAVVEVDRKSARPGGAMGFAAAGFWPGEQVYVVLGEGDAAVGPVVAGVDGEVAGVIVLPEDLEPGTHEIRAAGAGSALEAVERFPVRVDITPAASASGLQSLFKWIFLALAALVLLAVGAVALRRRQAADGTEPLDGDIEGLDNNDDDTSHASKGHGHDDDDNVSHPDFHTGSVGGSEAAGTAYEAYPSTSTPFPHPAMAGGVDYSTTEFEKKDLR